MENKVIRAEIRNERAFRRISAVIGYVIAAVLMIMLLTLYLKFKPETGEDITDGKLKQFLDVYSNKALLQTVILCVAASLLCYLPAFLADISTLAVAVAALSVMYQKTLGNISKFPNGFFVLSAVFFGASIFCAAKRCTIYNTKGRKFNFNPLVVISSFLMLANSFICKRIVDFKYEYEIYNRLVDITADDYVEKDWGAFRPMLQKIDLCVDADYAAISLVLAFVGVIILVLHNFPRLSLLASGTGAAYVLYKTTVGSIEVAPIAIFFVAVFSVAASVCAVSASQRLRDESEYPPEELDEDAEEDDEDDQEYLDAKKALEANGLEMQEYDC